MRKNETHHAKRITNRGLHHEISTWTLITALALASSVAAHAGTYTASTQTELTAAINAANANSDPASTITLTDNISLSNKTSFALTTTMTIDTNGFTLTGAQGATFNVADGAQLSFTGESRTTGSAPDGTLAMSGSGTKIVTGMTGVYTGSIGNSGGVLRIEGGSQITAGNSTSGALKFTASDIIVSGLGTVVNANDVARDGSAVGSGSSLLVEKGAHVNLGSVTMLGSGINRGNIVVTDLGSVLTASAISTTNQDGNILVSAGGRVTADRTTLGGLAQTPLPGRGDITVTGAGSIWSTSNEFRIHHGTLSVLDGGLVTATILEFAAAASGTGLNADVLVSGQGSTLALTGANSLKLGGRSGTATITVADGGIVNAGTNQIELTNTPLSTGVATLNIGGAVGEAATAAGTIISSGVVFGAGTGIINFNHTNPAYVFATPISGNGTVNQVGSGTTVLTGTNSYSGGTAINGGTLQIAADTNLGDASGGLSFDGGTLSTTTSFASARDIRFLGGGTLLTNAGTTFTLTGALSGTGALTKAGTGTLLLNGNNRGYTAATTVESGTLVVDGELGSLVTVARAGQLEGIGQVGGVTNSGIVSPGRNGIGTLTVDGDYIGDGGMLAIATVLGDDSSATSRLVVTGATSGASQVTVTNRGGLGGLTVEGIKIVEVAGASGGSFALNGDYLFQGEQAIIGGAYGYRLYQGGVADPADGDWYLRSTLLDQGQPVDPALPAQPLYQAGVPIYEVYGANLLALNGLPTLQQRVGNRSWAAGANPEGSGVWGRAEGTRDRANALISTSSTAQSVNSWKLHLGTDHVLKATGKGERLVAGITGYYGEANSDVRSVFGNGALKTNGYGIGATLSWYGLQGFYVDSQAQFSWYDSNLSSDVLGALAHDNDGSGEAFSVEVGKRTSVGGKLSVTPQIQVAYGNVRFADFTDPAGATVASATGDSLTTRGGISLDHQNSWDGGRSHIYGIVNLRYEWLDGTRTLVSGTSVNHANERLWGELGLGASIGWNKGVTLYGEVSGNSPFRDFGASYTLKANAGVRIAF